MNPGPTTAPARDETDSSVVTVDGGRLVGRHDPQSGVRSFLGVPYAAPPLRALRWRPPQPVEPWSGVRPARSLAPQCLQPGRPAGSVYAEYSGVQPMSEDCLYLNVWSAAPAPDARWPVMVWFHGGAFQQGAGSNPVFVRGDLPRHGVVLVTFNYRLGPFGFMAHPALSQESAQHASGNYGLLDMAAALAWVRRNIGAFGGDPDRVTLFGQSAGAAGVVDMMVAKATRGLYARAIAQSFGIARMNTLAEAERSGAAFAERIGATSLAALRELSGETLLARYIDASERWMPIVDGAFIERPVHDLFAEGRQDAVPLLTGWNSDEGTTFPAAASVAALRDRLQARFGERAGEAAALYPSGNDAQARRSSLELIGDDLFAWGVWRAANDHSRVAPTYLYHFAHPQPFAPEQRFTEAAHVVDLGVFHSAEYPYVFGSTAVLTRNWGSDDQRMTELMQAYWLQFAREGTPNRVGLAHWPGFADGTRSVLQLTPRPALIDVPRRPHLAFIDRAT
jgi:para-nitrobenzyl esterase